MLKRVERRPLGGEHCAGIALETKQVAALLDAVPVLYELLETHVAVECPEEGDRNVETGNGDRLPAVHFRSEASFSADRRGRRDVAARTHVLGKHAADEFIHIELRVNGHKAAP